MRLSSGNTGFRTQRHHCVHVGNDARAGRWFKTYHTKASLAHSLKTASDPAVVRSAFDLPAQQRAAIQNALNEIFSADIPTRFETAPDLISGIELSTNGQKVAWSIADYLEMKSSARVGSWTWPWVMDCWGASSTRSVAHLMVTGRLPPASACRSNARPAHHGPPTRHGTTSDGPQSHRCTHSGWAGPARADPWRPPDGEDCHCD